MKQGKTRILIADDHALMRVGIRSMLESTGDFTVIGECCDGESAVAMALKAKPDVVIMDLMMPAKDGVEATRELSMALPSAKTLILTTFGTSDGIAHALECGASGAVLKNAEDDELIDAVRKVAAGGKYVSPDVKSQLETDPPVPDLTPRQLEILDCMTRGLTNPDIARQLGIRRDGVAIHVATILQKIGAANRTEAVAIAMRKYLLKF